MTAARLVKSLVIVMAVAILALAAWCTADTPAVSTKGTCRIGVYDGRAVALAYHRSDKHKALLAQLFRKEKDASARGDTQLAQSLQNQLKRTQQRAHFQVFSQGPIDDIIATIKADLPKIAEKAQVQAIAPHIDYPGQGSNVIDITDLMVEAFHPDAKTLQMIGELRGKKAVPLEELDMKPTD